MLLDHPSGICASQERVCQLGCLASSCIEFLAWAVAIDYGEVIAGAGTRGLAAVQLRDTNYLMHLGYCGLRPSSAQVHREPRAALAVDDRDAYTDGSCEHGCPPATRCGHGEPVSPRVWLCRRVSRLMISPGRITRGQCAAWVSWGCWGAMRGERVRHDVGQNVRRLARSK